MRSRTIRKLLFFVAWIILGVFCSWSVRVTSPYATSGWAGEFWDDISTPNWDLVDCVLNPDGTAWHHSFVWEALQIEQVSREGESTFFEAYELNNWKPFFITDRFTVSQAAMELLSRLEAVERDGIDPAPYRIKELRGRIGSLDSIRQSVSSLEPSFRDVARLLPVEQPRDCRSCSDLLRYMEKGVGGMPPGHPATAVFPDFLAALKQRYTDLIKAACSLDTELTSTLISFSLEMNPYSREQQVEVLLGRLPMTQFLAGLEPSSPHYRPIRNTLPFYRSLAARNLHKPFNIQQTLRLGDTGAPVRQLQEHLKLEGFYTGSPTGQFDRETEQCVKAFQLCHLLSDDGAVGPQTRQWLNVPFDKKAQMLAQSLKLLRHSKSRPHSRFIRVNTPQFALEYYRDSKVESVHRVIVGKSAGKTIKVGNRMMGENHTPSLASNILRVIFNPRWYVSDRIRKELEAEIAADPNYFARNGYVQMSSSYPWGEPRIYQLPGPKNPLGRVKFEFPNPYAVFMHDTPNRNLFQRARRDFSHGCIRIDGAIELTRQLLEDDHHSAAQMIDRYLEGNGQKFVELNQPLPVIIEYVPVSTDGKGRVIFCGDPYGRFSS